jgi:aromatic ring-opening dioxygenase catalytic subunit (LigB family)
MQPNRLPSYFISHGGGPWPYVPEMRAAMQVLEASLADIPRQIGVVPSAVLMVSGHWEAPGFRVMAHARPPMVYDYGGFPPHTYHVQYPAPGAPALAARVQQLARDSGIEVQPDALQGFDHGTFAPLAVMYPQADVPVLQLSLKSRYDPAEHLAIGRALAPLRDEGVLIIGSGLSYHNLGRLGPMARQPSEAFDAWLQEAAVGLPPAERTQHLLQWQSAPAARVAHPREDHLIPLMVAVGAAEEEPGTLVYHETGVFGGMTASSFRFGMGASPTPAAIQAERH